MHILNCCFLQFSGNCILLHEFYFFLCFYCLLLPSLEFLCKLSCAKIIIVKLKIFYNVTYRYRKRTFLKFHAKSPLLWYVHFSRLFFSLFYSNRIHIILDLANNNSCKMDSEGNSLRYQPTNSRVTLPPLFLHCCFFLLYFSFFSASTIFQLYGVEYLRK